MVLLTAVPVSAPASILTGVMVATGAAPALKGCAMEALAVGGGAPAPSAVGGASAAISSLSPPNILSMSEQAARLSPVVNAKARNRPLLRPGFAEIPLIVLSAARRHRPAPDRPCHEIWRPYPTPSAAVGLGGPSPQS